MEQRPMHQGHTITNLIAMASCGMRLVWKAVVDYKGYEVHRSKCWARIYSDGEKAVVILTELKHNPGTSITNCYEDIATQLRTVVVQFIPEAEFPAKVVWMEQYEDLPTEIDHVTMLWTEKEYRSGYFLRRFATPPRWHRLTQVKVQEFGVEWEELCRVEVPVYETT